VLGRFHAATIQVRRGGVSYVALGAVGAQTPETLSSPLLTAIQATRPIKIPGGVRAGATLVTVSMANVEGARRGYAAAARGDLDAIRELLDPNVKWHGGDPTAPGACRNRDEAFQFMRQAHGRARSGSWSRSSTPAIAWS